MKKLLWKICLLSIVSFSSYASWRYDEGDDEYHIEDHRAIYGARDCRRTPLAAIPPQHQTRSRQTKSFIDSDSSDSDDEFTQDFNSQLVLAPKKPNYSLPSALWLKTTPQHIIDRFKKPTSPPPISSARARKISDPLGWIQQVQNQSILGTCSSFAVVDCLSYIHNRPLSQPYLITKAEKLDNCQNDGVTIGQSMQVAYKTGVIGRKWWLYENYLRKVQELNHATVDDTDAIKEQWNICLPFPYDSDQEKELVKFAFKKVKNLFHDPLLDSTGKNDTLLDKISIVKNTILSKNKPIVVSVPVKMNEEWSKTGDVKTLLIKREEPKKEEPLKSTSNTRRIIHINPTISPIKKDIIVDEEDNIDGLHAIIIYGFDDQKREFYFKNSWGNNWGKEGLGIIGYDYLQRHCREAWIGYGKVLKS
jgi:hypothetical protein